MGVEAVRPVHAAELRSKWVMLSIEMGQNSRGLEDLSVDGLGVPALGDVGHDLASAKHHSEVEVRGALLLVGCSLKKTLIRK